MNFGKKKKWLIGAAVVLVLVGAGPVFDLIGSRREIPSIDREAMTPQRGMENVTYGYTQALQDYAKAGRREGTDRLTLSARDAILEGDARLEEAVDYEGGDTMVYSGEKDNSVTWEFEIASEGLYEVTVDYLAMEGNGAKIQRTVLIDGTMPFEEAASISFYRVFREGNVTWNSIGDEVWPVQEEDCIWQSVGLQDGQGFFENPLLFYLEKGKHSLTFRYIDQAMGIGNLTIAAPEPVMTYAQVSAEYERQGYRNASEGSNVKIQAEDSSWRNDSVIRRENNVDPNVEPYDLTVRLLNTVGGYRWRVGNQSVSWDITVPESGLYTINMKTAQSTTNGMPSYRKITIDGKVPFEEMKLYQFDYNKIWYGETLSDKEGNPYLFYLEKGTHELTLEVKLGDFTEIIERTIDDLQYLSDLTREITKITGTEPDPNYEYELYRSMPELSDEMGYVADRLEETAGLLAVISNEKTSMENNYRTIVDMLREFEKDVDTIPRALSELDTALSNMGTYITSIQICPLCLDYIEVTSPDTEFVVPKTSFLKKAWATTVNFVMSFFKDYDSIGMVTDASGEQKVLEVWIARGADWGELLKEMADEQFTPETGIVVNVNVIPSGQLSTGSINTLMLSVTSNDAPDVALSVDYNLPSEFAFRGAAVDLTQFEGYEELAAQYYNTMFEPYRYSGGVYAFPETMDFTCMIYRTDIIEDLGIEIPETWDDLLQTVLPTLYENSMTFAFPVDTTISTTSPSAYRGFTMLLLQKGGAYYSEDLRSSALDSAVAYDAFKMWTNMYTNYDVDEQSNFFTRMRTGTQPIGIGNYTTYLQLLTSAPELYGRWAIAPVPGMRQEDGSVNNVVGTISSTSCMILEQSDLQQEAWQFLQWWLSEETQVNYGRQLEALLGTGARWNTANKEAFYSLPWDRDDEAVIKDSLETAIEQPIVPGGYFTGRHIINAWNRVCVNNENVRDALEKAVKDIDEEIINKRKEFNLEQEEPK